MTKIQTIHTDFCAEIIESSLYTWKAQCWKWNAVPSFGSLVVTSYKSIQIFGIVEQIITGSHDTFRQPIAYQKTEEELLQEQPQIFEFLQTTFNCIIIGYEYNNTILYQLPDTPPSIHAFVKSASQEEWIQCFNNEHFLYMLFNLSHKIANIDELLLAVLKQQLQRKILTKQALNNFIDVFAMMHNNDYQKLKIFLHRTNLLLNSITI